MSDSTDWNERFASKRAKFIERVKARLAAAEELLTKARAGTAADVEIQAIIQHFHQISGSAGIYGIETVSRLAGQCEAIAIESLSDSTMLSPEASTRLGSIVKELRDCLNKKPETPAATPQAPSFATEPENREIMLVTSNPAATNFLARELNKDGIEVKILRHASDALKELEQWTPYALIVFTPLPDGPAYEIARTLRTRPGGDMPPIIFVSKTISFLDKVNALRCGVNSYLQPPVEPDDVIRKLQSLLKRPSAGDYKVLSVEDDPDQASFIQTTLESAGYQVQVIADATRFESALISFNPDILLLDVMLGQYTGFDLALIAGQDSRFSTLPIIFLTTKNQLQAHLESNRVGGDDHLIKPVAPQLLIATIKGRLAKYASLKKHITHDGLTQCLNYASFMDSIDNIAKPDSRRFALGLVIFDIDRLSDINQSIGFAGGDQLIVALSKILKETFRTSGTIGRLGGGKFGVVVENLVEAELLESARGALEIFARRVNKPGTLVYTARAGLSMITEFITVRDLIANAERALDQARNEGGNRAICGQSQTYFNT